MSPLMARILRPSLVLEHVENGINASLGGREDPTSHGEQQELIQGKQEWQYVRLFSHIARTGNP